MSLPIGGSLYEFLIVLVEKAGRFEIAFEQAHPRV
jgi:hypothetical protein